MSKSGVLNVHGCKFPNERISQFDIMYRYITKNCNKAVMYCVLMDCEVEYDDEIKEETIIKIGYSENILQRLRTLKKEYDCEKLSVLSILPATHENETTFHKLCSDYKLNCWINEKKRREVYRFTYEIMLLFEIVLLGLGEDPKYRYKTIRNLCDQYVVRYRKLMIKRSRKRKYEEMIDLT